MAIQQTDKCSSQVYSWGNANAAGTVPFYFDQWTEFPKSALIPAATAESAIREWLASGKLAKNVHWVQD